MYLRLSDARVTMIFLRNCQKTTEYKYVLAYVLATNRNSHWSHHYIIILIPPTFQQPKKNSDPTPLIFFALAGKVHHPSPFLVGSNQKHHQNPWPFARLLVLHLDSLKLVLLHLPVHIRPVYLRERNHGSFHVSVGIGYMFFARKTVLKNKM